MSKDFSSIHIELIDQIADGLFMLHKSKTNKTRLIQAITSAIHAVEIDMSIDSQKRYIFGEERRNLFEMTKESRFNEAIY